MELSCLFLPDVREIGISVRLCPYSKVFAGFNRVRSFEDNFPLFIIHLELDGLPMRGVFRPFIEAKSKIYYYLSSKDPLLAVSSM